VEAYSTTESMRKRKKSKKKRSKKVDLVSKMGKCEKTSKNKTRGVNGSGRLFPPLHENSPVQMKKKKIIRTLRGIKGGEKGELGTTETRGGEKKGGGREKKCSKDFTSFSES